MNELDGAAGVAQTRELRLQNLAITNQQNRRLVLDSRLKGAGHDGVGSEVSPHRVYGNVHACALMKIAGWTAWPRATPGELRRILRQETPRVS